MEIGDLLFLLMLGIGVLSSAFGGKKKKGAQRGGRAPGATARPVARPRPRSRPAPPAPQRVDDVRSQMEQILRELQLGGREPEPPPPPRMREPEREPEYRAPVSLEIPSRPIEDELHEEAHEAFHQQYVRPLKQQRARRRGAARVRRFMTKAGLRDAILAREILGPPRALQDFPEPRV